jgi:hypothetical protein
MRDFTASALGTGLLQHDLLCAQLRERVGCVCSQCGIAAASGVTSSGERCEPSERAERVQNAAQLVASMCSRAGPARENELQQTKALGELLLWCMQDGTCARVKSGVRNRWHMLAAPGSLHGMTRCSRSSGRSPSWSGCCASGWFVCHEGDLFKQRLRSPGWSAAAVPAGQSLHLRLSEADRILLQIQEDRANGAVSVQYSSAETLARRALEQAALDDSTRSLPHKRLRHKVRWRAEDGGYIH